MVLSGLKPTVRDTGRVELRQCTARTQLGDQCGHMALDGRDVCATHAPERQCGAIKDDGSRCIVATGGRGRCRRHLDR